MTEAREFFQQAKLYTDDQEYVMLSLPARGIMLAAGILAEVGDPFGAVIADKDEVTLIIPSDLVHEFENRLPEYQTSEPMRLITFDVALPMNLIGFMAFVAQLLADAKVSIIPLAAYQRDHLLVSAAQFEQAWQALQKAQHVDD